MTSSTAVKKTVVVLGMHRSGTSLVAGILHALGVNMGARAEGEAWVGRHWSNPTGHFENAEFVSLDYRILGGDATGIRGPPRWEDVAARSAQFEAEARALIRRHEAEMWGWKDPWTVLTLEVFLPLLRSPYFVMVRRPKEEVLASLRKRSTSQDSDIAELFDVYEQRLAELKERLRSFPVIEVDYPTLLREPSPTVGRLIEFLGLRPTREELDRALGMVLGGAELRRESQRMAIRGVFGFPRWVGWVLKRDLRNNPDVVATDLFSSVPKELFQMFRTLL
ncbi:MAG: sulfotransferase [Thermoplasmata archaeon]|nr:sulfotransferase [Thermoplasmata archaeon]MCI4359430.1 sulfotransferase [Thermoplasmata archaeon]